MDRMMAALFAFYRYAGGNAVNYAITPSVRPAPATNRSTNQTDIVIIACSIGVAVVAIGAVVYLAKQSSKSNKRVVPVRVRAAGTAGAPGTVIGDRRKYELMQWSL